MCKRLLTGTAVLLTLMISAGCARTMHLADSHVDIYKRIHQKYSRMTAYTADVTLTVKSRNSENVYLLKQQVKEPQMAMITVREPASMEGVCTVFNGGQALVSSPVSTQKLMTKINFFSAYYRSEETAVSVGTAHTADTMLLETECLPQTAEAYTATLLLDTKTLHPKTITVFDAGGNVRMLAEFSNFCYNPSLPEDIFDLTKQ